MTFGVTLGKYLMIVPSANMFYVAKDFIKTTHKRTTDYRPTDPPITYHLPNDPPATYSPIYVKIEDQILNMFHIL